MARPNRIRIPRKPRSFGAPSSTPVPAVVLTIDAATCSGVAIYVAGKLHHYAEVNAFDGPSRRHVLQDARTVADVRGLPLACVLEVPFGGHTSAALALTAIVALWRDSWRGLGLPAAHMLEYTASEWRRALFGAPGMPRKEARKLEAALASTVAGRDMPAARHYTIGPDAAAAICIGQVVIRSGALAEALALHATTHRRHTV